MAKPRSRERTVPPDQGPGGVRRTTDFDEGVNYTCGIKIFQASSDALRGIDFLSAADFPSETLLPGYLCQAARLLLGLTQQELHVRADVSKKSINDYENGFIAVRAALAERLAIALRKDGARFIAGDGFVGVIVHGRRPRATASPSRKTERRAKAEVDSLPEAVGLLHAHRPRQVRRTKRKA